MLILLRFASLKNKSIFSFPPLWPDNSGGKLTVQSFVEEHCYWLAFTMEMVCQGSIRQTIGISKELRKGQWNVVFFSKRKVVVFFVVWDTDEVSLQSSDVFDIPFMKEPEEKNSFVHCFLMLTPIRFPHQKKNRFFNFLMKRCSTN